MKSKIARLQTFDAKARQTKILNRLVELSQDEKKQIDDQVLARAMHQFTSKISRTRRTHHIYEIRKENYFKYVIAGFIFCLLIFIVKGYLNGQQSYPSRQLIVPTQKPAPTIVLTATPTPTVAPLKTRTNTGNGTWIGKVSHYSRAGCLGCSATLTMANGHTLDDNAMTIAFNWLPMNTQVRVTNLDNGKSVIATVTDTGGFNSLNRIADLVPAVANELGTKTDVTNVLIEQL